MRLNALCPELTTYAGVCCPELIRLIYLSRPDIQRRFSINDILGRTVMLVWYYLYGRKELKLFVDDIPVPQWHLLQDKCEEMGLYEDHFFTKMQAMLWLASPLTKDCFDLNQLDDRLSIELVVAACITKPPELELIPISKKALFFSDTVDPAFITNLPIPVCRLISSVWRARKDLQASFPIGSKENEAALVLWFLNHGRKELDLSSTRIKTMDKEYLLGTSSDLQADGEIMVSRLAHLIWCSNSELQTQYDLHSSDRRIAFVSWFQDIGIAEYGLEWLFEDSQLIGQRPC